MSRLRIPTRAVFGLSILALAATPSAAQQSDRTPGWENESAHKYFTDVALVNQDGRKIRLYSDLIQGHVVIMNSFFTTCKGVCPPMNHKLAQVQEWLGERLDREVRIVSFTVDPATDTPARLSSYAATLGARQGWYFLTGSEENLSFALKKLGQYVADPDSHKGVLLIGNDRTGLWKKAFALAGADQIIEVVRSVVEDQPPR